MDSIFDAEWKILIFIVYNLTFTAAAGLVLAKLLIKDRVTSEQM